MTGEPPRTEWVPGQIALEVVPRMLSGFCQFAMHASCRGDAAGDRCGCECHTPPPVLLSSLQDRVMLLLSDVRSDSLCDLQARARQLIRMVRAGER